MSETLLISSYRSSFEMVAFKKCTILFYLIKCGADSIPLYPSHNLHTMPRLKKPTLSAHDIVCHQLADVLNSFVNSEDGGNYEKLLKAIVDPDVNELLLKCLLQQVNACDVNVVPRLSRFVWALLCVAWEDRTPDFQTEYFNALHKIATENDYHFCFQVVSTLVSKFQWIDFRQNQCVHAALSKMLNNQTAAVFLEQLRLWLPRVDSATEIRENYLRNLDRFSEYSINFVCCDDIRGLAGGKVGDVCARVPVEIRNQLCN